MKQEVNVRLTKEANKILDQWKRKYGGLSKSETILRVDEELDFKEDLRSVKNAYLRSFKDW